MAHPSGNISFAEAGTLRVYLSGLYKRNNADSGFPNQSDGNVRIRAYVGPTGSYTYTTAIDKYTQSTFIDVAYPGGNVTWNVGTETLEYQQAAGTVQIAMTNLRVSWELVKK